MLLTVLEEPSPRGCSWLDRRTFRIRTLRRLREEFGDRLEVRWDEPGGTEARTIPTLLLDGRLVRKGGYLPWEVLRPIVAHALAVEDGVEEFASGAAELAETMGLSGADWQENLLAWIERDESDPGAADGGPTTGSDS